jgi:hypothetical protein
MRTAILLLVFCVLAIVPSASAAETHPSKAQVRHEAKKLQTPHLAECTQALHGLVYYNLRYRHWMALRGHESVPPASRPSGCAHARYRASVWKERAATARVAYERWQRSIGVVIKRLDRGLAGSPMNGTGVNLERWGRQYHVSPYFMAAAAATESSLGVNGCGEGGRNAWGLGNCGSAWSVPSFSSWDEAIAYYARYIAHGWPYHSTPYSFHGYAKCDSCWGNSVSGHMHDLFGVAAVTRYP